jgi:small conductance mechanosensitive channel
VIWLKFPANLVPWKIFNFLYRNKTIIIPNAQATGGNITNYTTKGTLRVDMVFGIGYNGDIKKAKQILEEIVAADERILEDPAPTVAISELADSSVNFVVRPFARVEDYWSVYFETTESVKERFDAEGVSIPFPQRDVHLFQEISNN